MKQKKKAKNPGGRPPVEGESRVRRMQLRMTEERYRALFDLATRRGKSASEIVREALDLYHPDPDPDPGTSNPDPGNPGTIRGGRTR